MRTEIETFVELYYITNQNANYKVRRKPAGQRNPLTITAPGVTHFRFYDQIKYFRKSKLIYTKNINYGTTYYFGKRIIDEKTNEETIECKNGEVIFYNVESDNHLTIEEYKKICDYIKPKTYK